MKKGGIKYVHVFAVDNAICKVGDPTFMGYCIDQGADCGNKVVWKTQWDESVGVVAKRGGKYTVVEYSEISDEQAQQKDANGKLVYGAGNICNHFYTLDLLERVTDDVLIFHVARKAIPYAGDDGKTIKPAKKDKNGIKLECFIFDAFCLSKKMAVLEASREDEFSPVKNAPGDPTDSPDSAREMINQQSRKWAEAAGATINVDGLFEVSPLVSFKGEGLESLSGQTITKNLLDSV
jgi:UDP-N-acetylglucosamine/UDP-N-acetylgalactosamine diphosphorylase